MAQGVLPDETPEPLRGIGPLSGALDAFVAFFSIDADFVAVAAERAVRYQHAQPERTGGAETETAH